MVLRSANASPFARKVRIAADVLGLIDKIEIRNVNTADPADPIVQQNPLGKLPVLVLDDGRAIYDSSVIVEYLDALAGGGKVIPAASDARFAALTLAALADGILEAAILIIYEGRYRPDQPPYQPWLDFQRGKIERALAAVAAKPPAQSAVTIGTIGLAAALGYLDFRKQVDWRAKYPVLIAWLDAFRAKVPAFDRTRPDA
jgi:glutathione S-transferase